MPSGKERLILEKHEILLVLFSLNSSIKTKRKLLQVIIEDIKKYLHRRQSEEVDTLLT